MPRPPARLWSSSPALFAATATLLAVGCRFDAAVPPGVEIRCQEDAHCPGDMRCQVSLQRCVPTAGLDPNPPGLDPGSVRLTLVPGRDSPLAVVDTMTRGTVAVIGFVADEPLRVPADLVLVPPLQCERSRSGDADFEFRCTVPPGAAPPDGPVSATAQLEDLAGNTADVPLLGLGLVLDTTPPPPPTVDAPGVLVYERVPWGSDATGGVVRYALSGGAGAAPDASLLRAFSGPLLRAEAPIAADGSVGALALAPLDTALLEVDSVDRAGNVSPRVAVRDGRWVASLRGKLAGRAAPNPHLVGVVGALGSFPGRPDLQERGESSGVTRGDGVVTTAAGAPSWRSLDSSWLVGYRAAAWDARRGRLVSVGANGLGALGAAEWDGQRLRAWATFSDPEGDGSPVLRAQAALVHDERQDSTFLLGGWDGQGWLGEAWAWRVGSWERLSAAPALARPVAFYDSARGRTVLVGGPPDGGAGAGTWSFDGLTWSDLGAPLPRPPTTIAFDRQRGVAVGLVPSLLPDGGDGAQSPWRFDGAAWSPADGGASPLAGRFFLHAAYDERDDRLLFAGGDALDANRDPVDDTWSWSGGGWEQLADAGVPLGGQLAAFAWDPVHGQALVLSPNRVLALEGATWVVRAASSPRPGPDAVSALDCAVELGGCVAASDGGLVALGERGWGATRTLGVPGSSMVPSVLAWDAARKQLVWTGGALTATWDPRSDAGASLVAWDGGDPLLAPGLGATAAFDGTAVSLVRMDKVVRSWAGGGWTPRDPVPYTTRTVLDWIGACSLADAGLLLLGGSAGASGCGGTTGPETGTWLLADAGWTAVIPPAPPMSAVMLDPARGSSLAFGGVDTSYLTHDDLLERGTDGGWSVVATSDPELDQDPRARNRARLAFDPQEGRGVLFGGATSYGAPPTLNDTWALETARHRPAVQVRFQLDRAELPQSTTLVAVELRAVAGGAGLLDGGAAPGVRGLVWRDRTWVDDTVGVAGFPTTAPGELRVRTSDAAALARLLANQPALEYALVPRGENGTGTATVAVDTVELTVEYRLP